MLEEKEIEFDEEYFDGFYLIRFLRARNLNLNNTFKMFTEFLKWRETENLDNIKSFVYIEESKIKEFYPHTFHNTDKIGRPLYIERWKDMNLEEIGKITTIDRFMKYYIQKCEFLIETLLPKASIAANRFIGQTCMIFDIRDFSSNQVNKLFFTLMEKQFYLDMNYYPELLGNCYICNNSFFYKAIWGIACGLLHETTRSKIKFISSNYAEELLKIVDADKLPKFLGGNCECKNGCMNTNLGPWND